MLILGAVREIHQYRLLLSLPFNMTGFVNIGDVSDPLAAEGHDSEEDAPNLLEMFYIGQILTCYVLEVTVQQKHVPLALNPRLVNCHLTAKSLHPNMVSDGL